MSIFWFDTYLKFSHALNEVVNDLRWFGVDLVIRMVFKTNTHNIKLNFTSENVFIV